MPKAMNINIEIELTGDEWEEAAQKVALKPAWDQFEAALRDAGINFESRIDTWAVRPKKQPAVTGAKRGRKPRTPVLVPALHEPGDDAA